SVLRFCMTALTAWLVLSSSAAAQPTTAKQEARLDLYGDPLPAEALARLGTTRWRIGGFISMAAASRDGKLIAYSSNRNDITIADRVTGTTLRTLKTGFLFLGNNDAFVFSPDNKYLAGPSGNNTIVLVDAETGKQVRQTKSSKPNRFGALAYSA